MLNYNHRQAIVNTSSSKDILHELLMQLENFWIQKLKTLVPYGLNQVDIHAVFSHSRIQDDSAAKST